MRESFRTIRDETNETIKGFLTPDQYAAYEESHDSDWDRRGGGRDGGRPPDGGSDRRRGR